MSIKYKTDTHLLKALKNGEISEATFEQSINQAEQLALQIGYEAVNPYARPIVLAACKIAVDSIKEATKRYDGKEKLENYEDMTACLVAAHVSRKSGRHKEEEKK